MSDPFPELEEEQTPEERAAGLRTFRIIVWLFVALFAGMGLFALFGPDRQPAPEQPAGYADTVGGAFSLTAADGSTVTDQTLKGKPFAIFFGFTRCPDVCPTTLASLAKLRKQMGEDGDKFRIVFVSVDPGSRNQAEATAAKIGVSSASSTGTGTSESNGPNSSTGGVAPAAPVIRWTPRRSARPTRPAASHGSTRSGRTTRPAAAASTTISSTLLWLHV